MILIIFPLIYLLSFLFALREVLKGNKQGVLLFFIFGISIYITSQSLSFFFGFGFLIPFLQPLKELLVIITLSYSIWTYKGRFKFHLIDYLILFYTCYTFLYAILPLGSYGFFARVSALKSISFFVALYALGRLFKITEIYIGKYFKYILVVAIAAAFVLGFELFTGTNFQSRTGYADFNFYYLGMEPSGNYGLTWTFENDTGQRRFASFFADPLDYAAATLLALAAIVGLYTTDKNKLKIDNFGVLAFAATQFSIFGALSRSSFVSYFMMIYVYGVITGKKYIIHIIHALLAIIVVYFIFLLTNRTVYDLVMDSITFQNASSLGHLLEWIAGIQAMIASPLGLGLGASGKISGLLGENIGGENQFIIIGVQAGVIALFAYLALQIALIRYPYKWIKKLKGKERKIAITLFLLKVGSLIPLFTAEFESYTYVGYIGWFLSGLFVSTIADKGDLQTFSYETN